mmetsp:Transcript_27657/g.35951  ORF Transcript_27657/g.35951 Transcript_27657/m.35951 type:complete len:301 (-) Transcript_27657:104-1006(-)
MKICSNLGIKFIFFFIQFFKYHGYFVTSSNNFMISRKFNSFWGRAVKPMLIFEEIQNNKKILFAGHGDDIQKLQLKPSIRRLARSFLEIWANLYFGVESNAFQSKKAFQQFARAAIDTFAVVNKLKGGNAESTLLKIKSELQQELYSRVDVTQIDDQAGVVHVWYRGRDIDVDIDDFDTFGHFLDIVDFVLVNETDIQQANKAEKNNVPTSSEDSFFDPYSVEYIYEEVKRGQLPEQILLERLIFNPVDYELDHIKGNLTLKEDYDLQITVYKKELNRIRKTLDVFLTHATVSEIDSNQS